ncbi:MAG: cadherin repeat domain-containing protein, partial [Draconibacterium sp.]
DKTVKSGETIEIEVEMSDLDPVDLDALWEKMGPILQQHGYDKSILPSVAATQPKCSPFWWQYKEAGSYNGYVDLVDNLTNKVQFVAPKVSEPETIHLILEAKDSGSPALTAFARVLITVMPN